MRGREKDLKPCKTWLLSQQLHQRLTDDDLLPQLQHVKGNRRAAGAEELQALPEAGADQRNLPLDRMSIAIRARQRAQAHDTTSISSKKRDKGVNIKPRGRHAAILDNSLRPFLFLP
jgi:IS5 family transposase